MRHTIKISDLNLRPCNQASGTVRTALSYRVFKIVGLHITLVRYNYILLLINVRALIAFALVVGFKHLAN